ncbi:MAG: HAD family hydrolase [Stenotrophomonas sp.]|jgi:HAD superfamily hydrolase (TIGR01549 family)|nr:HAD family hydrolase [Stenotrophomonas sp.]
MEVSARAARAAQPGLGGVRHWVFDMDGTLTVAAHDFAAIKRALDIAADDDIIAHLAALPHDEARAKRAWLFEHERALAEAAVAAEGAVDLLRALAAQGCRLGILTRNDHALAKLTLVAIGLGDLFTDADIIGRDEVAPKPAPDGLHYFLGRWGIAAAQAVMVGDHRMDLAAGRAAGTCTVLVNTPGDPWPGMADWRFADCRALHAASTRKA